MNWNGYAVSDSQSLAFPRIGSYFDPRKGVEVSFDDVDTPEMINRATYEIAYHLLNNDGLLDDTGSVTNVNVGRIKLERVQTAPTIPSFAKRMIKPMLVNAGANNWWRAN